jgi:hypothetical protein
MTRSTRALEIPTSYCDSHPASSALSPLIPSTCTLVLPISADRSLPSGGCRPRSCSYTSIASRTSRSVSYRQRRIWRSSNVRLRSVSYLVPELQTRARAKKSCWTALARTQLASHYVCTFPAIQLPLLGRELPLELDGHCI